MRIAIDARMIKPGSMHGIARYVYELIRGLSVRDCGFDFDIFVNRDSPLFDEAWPSNMKFTEIKASWISFREQFEIPSVLKAGLWRQLLSQRRQCLGENRAQHGF